MLLFIGMAFSLMMIIGCNKDNSPEEPVNVSIRIFASDTVPMVGVPISVFIDDLSSQNIEIYTIKWTMPGAIPQESEELSPTIHYDRSGIYDIKVIVETSQGTFEHESKRLIRAGSGFGGEWTRINMPAPDAIYNSCFEIEGDLYMNSSKGFYKSSDAGVSWEYMSSAFPNLQDLKKFNNRMYAVFSDGIIAYEKYSDNGGITWYYSNFFAQTVYEATSCRLIKVQNKLILRVNCQFARFYYSDDEGVTWSDDEDLNLLAYINEGELFSLGNYAYLQGDYNAALPAIYRTSDGNSWEKISNHFCRIESIVEMNNVLYGVFAKGRDEMSTIKLYTSVDNGYQWTLVSEKVIWDICFYNGNLFGLANGEGFYNLNTFPSISKDNGKTWITITDNLMLYQNLSTMNLIGCSNGYLIAYSPDYIDNENRLGLIKREIKNLVK